MSNGVITGCLPGNYEREQANKLLHEYSELVAQQQARIDTLEKLAEQYQALADNQEALIKELNEKPAKICQHIKECMEVSLNGYNDASKSNAYRTAAYYAAEALRLLLSSLLGLPARTEPGQATCN